MQDIFFPPHHPERLCDHSHLPIPTNGIFLPEVNGRGVKVITYRLVPRLRISGSVPGLFCTRAFMEYRGTNLIFLLQLNRVTESFFFFFPSFSFTKDKTNRGYSGDSKLVLQLSLIGGSMKGRSRFASNCSIAVSSVTFILNSTEDGRYPYVSSGIVDLHPCIISQISPTRCTILLNIFISLLYMFRASMCPLSGENYCIYATLVTGICHSVWVASGLLVGFSPTNRPDATHTE